MAPAPAAERLGLLRLGEDRRDGGSWPEMLSDPRTGWSRLHWAQRIDPESLKPAAEVLAVARPASAGVGANPELEAPVVLSMRYGAGRVLYVGTDEIWRWRYARGEALPERFWLPLIRLQGRESLARSARAAALEVTPRRAEAQQPVRVSVTLLDQALLDAAPSSVTVRLTRVREPGEAAIEAGGAGNGPVEITLRPESADADGTRGAARSFAAVWAADEPGRYIVEPSDPLLSGLGLSAEVRVAWSDDEMRRPEADHELLERLSASTEGAVLATGELGRVPELLPRREVQIAGTPEIRTLWDRPVVLALLVLLLTAEWVGRKLIKLV